MEYGLIGNPLKHSFSKSIHAEISKLTFDKYIYILHELKEDELDDFFKNKDFKAINVTIPYKQKVIKYLDDITPQAKQIGAVNCIVNKNGVLKGYNSDYFGLKAIIENLKIDNINCALILGNGGTSNTCLKVLQDLNVQTIKRVCRTVKNQNLDITFNDLTPYYNKCDLIVNTTPVGMYPHNDDRIIDLTLFTSLKGVCDVIFNPLRTNLVLDALNLGLKASGGLYMLVSQAVYAYTFFKDLDIDVKYITDKIYQKILKEKTNIVFVGMPGCGKSKLAGYLKHRFNKPALDTDDLIKNEIQMEIKDFFEKYNEEAFRDIESKVIKEVSLLNSHIIATGGGAVLRKENINRLKQNGKIYFLNRSISLIKPTASRPLSNDLATLQKRYEERLPIYKSVCDKEINGDLELEDKALIIEGDIL